MLTGDGLAAEPARRRLLIAAAVLAGAFIVGIEIAALHYGFQGPTPNLTREFVFPPQRSRLLWAGLILAMVGLNRQQRIRCISIAIAIDLVFIAGRFLAGVERVSFGNGALMVLLGLALWAARNWTGEQRANALRSAAMGATLIVASKVGDAWLRITSHTRPDVWDGYAVTADEALGNPSWWVGRLVEASGSIGHLILQTIYIDLPVGAIVVAVYQLRKGWPQHHLVRTFLLIGLIGPAFYVLFPVVGPIYAYGTAGRGWAFADLWPNYTPVGLTPMTMPFDTLTPRNCMPSLHTAWTVAIFIHTRRAPRLLRYFGAFWLGCTLLATLGFGYHYGVDLIAGVVFALTIESALRDPERGWGWFRWRLVIGGAVGLAGLLLSYRYLAGLFAREPIPSGTFLLLVLATSIITFYATFFAKPESPLGRWGRPDDPDASATADPADRHEGAEISAAVTPHA